MILGYNVNRQAHFDNMDEVIPELHSIGVRSANIVLGFKPFKHNKMYPLHPSVYINWEDPESAKKVPIFCDKARDLGWKITLKPHFHPDDLKLAHPYQWWSGLCNFTGNEKVYFESFNKAVFGPTLENIKPDSVCVQNEMMQMLGEESMWNRIIDSIPPDCDLTVATNFFQPYKETKAWKSWLINRFFITKEYAKEWFRDWDIDSKVLDVIPWKTFKAPTPKWFSRLDSIGVNAYCFPAFTDDSASVDKIVDLYTDYEIKKSIKIGWFKYTYKEILNYPDLICDFARVRGKKLRITEIDAIMPPVGNNYEAYKRYWTATFKVFQDLPIESLDVWDDGNRGWWVKQMLERKEAGEIQLYNEQLRVKV